MYIVLYSNITGNNNCPGEKNIIHDTLSLYIMNKRCVSEKFN